MYQEILPYMEISIGNTCLLMMRDCAVSGDFKQISGDGWRGGCSLPIHCACCYLQVCTNTKKSPGTKNTQLLAFSFLVNLTFSASLRSYERMWRQRPSNPDHPARSNILCSCFKISIVQYLEVKYPLFLHQNIQNLPRRWWKQAASRTRTFLQQRSSTRWDCYCISQSCGK